MLTIIPVKGIPDIGSGDNLGEIIVASLKDQGEEFQEGDVRAGDLVSFVKVTTGSGVKPVQLASIHEIDVEKYNEYIRSTFEQVLDSVGLDYEELTGARKLTSFFSGA